MCAALCMAGSGGSGGSGVRHTKHTRGRAALGSASSVCVCETQPGGGSFKRPSARPACVSVCLLRATSAEPPLECSRTQEECPWQAPQTLPLRAHTSPARPPSPRDRLLSRRPSKPPSACGRNKHAAAGELSRQQRCLWASAAVSCHSHDVRARRFPLAPAGAAGPGAASSSRADRASRRFRGVSPGGAASPRHRPAVPPTLNFTLCLLGVYVQRGGSKPAARPVRCCRPKPFTAARPVVARSTQVRVAGGGAAAACVACTR